MSVKSQESFEIVDMDVTEDTCGPIDAKTFPQSSADFPIFQEIVKNVNFADYKPQKFSIGEKLTTYLMNHSSYHLLRKLYQTCKFFFAKTRLHPVHHLEVSEKRDCSQRNYSFCGYNMTFAVGPFDFKLDNLWLTNTFSAKATLLPDGFAFKIVRSDIKTLDLCRVMITLRELEKLCTSKLLKTVKLVDVKIPSGNTYMDFGGLLKYIPYATHITFTNCCHLSLDDEKFSRKALIEVLNLGFCQNNYYQGSGRGQSLHEDLKSLMAPNSKINIWNPKNRRTLFTIRRMAKNWEPQNERPIVTCHHPTAFE